VEETTVEFAAASGWLQSIWLLVAIPLVSAAVLLLLGRRADKWGHWLGVLSVVVCFGLGLSYFLALSDLGGNKSAEVSLYEYMAVGAFHVDVGMLLDPLSAVFVLLITGVGSLIHIYAVGYMEHDPGRRRFFG
jgi:NADH-quinone oxidoreductase subunit L